MVWTNVYVQRGAALLALCFLWSCDASLMNPGQRIVTPESSPQVALPVMPALPVAQALPVLPQAAPARAPETMPLVEPYDAGKPSEDAQVEESDDSSESETPGADTVVHYAEVRGRVERQAGQRLTIEPLLATSETWPVPGCMADLWVESKTAGGASDWEHFAEVKVVNRLELGMPMEVDIVDDVIEEHAVKQAHAKLSSGSRLRIQWQW